MTAASVAAERASIRTASLAALAALGAGIGLFYTHRNYKHQVQVAVDIERDRRAQAGLAQRTFVAERFNDAVKQLADRDSQSVRVAGAYSLESVATQDLRQRKPVGDVLTAFLLDYGEREPTRRPAPPELPPIPIDEIASLALDARAAAIVLARLGVTVPISLASVDLSDLDLRGANLGLCDLRQAKLTRADLSDSSLFGSDLSGAIALFTRFDRSSMDAANCSGGTFFQATFDDAEMANLDFGHARLSKEDLSPRQRRQVKRLDRPAELSAGVDDTQV